MTVNVDDGGPDAAARTDPAARTPSFEVHLDVFEGPFDLLLALISKHKLDITEVALSQVTDEFIAYISERSDGWDLDQVSYFLVVAATLLDLKAARLLPSGEVEDEVRARWIPGETFHDKPVLSRAIIVAAGPVANFVLAVALFGLLFATLGLPYTLPVERRPMAAKAGARRCAGWGESCRWSRS